MSSVSEVRPVARLAAGSLCLLGAVFFLWALADLGLLWESSTQFRLHHEMTTPLSFLLAKLVAALACGAAGLGCLGRGRDVGVRHPDDSAALVFVALLLVAAGIVLDNETFFSLYDYKGFPVHPTEIFMHPTGGWFTPFAHITLCLLGLAGGAAFLVLTREKPT